MLQAPMFDGLSLDPFSLFDDGFGPAEVGFRRRHIVQALVFALGMALADRLDATFIYQRYSRLVIDCNRRPGAPDSIPPVSDGTAIAANASLGAVGAVARAEAIQAPYQAAIASEIERRKAADQETFLIEYGRRSEDYVDYVRGANIAGFKKVADAMLAYGAV